MIDTKNAILFCIASLKTTDFGHIGETLLLRSQTTKK